jgi:hypothetical protein
VPGALLDQNQARHSVAMPGKLQLVEKKIECGSPAVLKEAGNGGRVQWVSHRSIHFSRRC